MYFKKLFTITCSLCWLITCLRGQTLEIENSSVAFNDKVYASLEVKLDPDSKTVKKAWHDYLKENHDVDIKGIGFLTNKDVLKGEQVSFSNLPVETVNFYTKVVSEGDQCVMSVFAFDSNDDFTNQDNHPEMYGRIRNMLTSFLNEFLNSFYQEKVEEVEDEIVSLEKDISDNRDQIEDNRKEIENLRNENTDMQKEIEEKEVRLQKVREKLNNKQNDLNNINSKLRKQALIPGK